MKKYFLTAVGLAAMLHANSPILASTELNGHLLALGNSPSFYRESPPAFIYVPELGYSVAVETPYDFIYYDNYYYLFDSGYWYSSSFYDGPWIGIIGERLPPLLRGHHIGDIRRFREIEYGKQDRHYCLNKDQPERRSQTETHSNTPQGLSETLGTRSKRSQSQNDDDGKNRGDRQTAGDTRGSGNIRGGDTHPPGGGQGGRQGGGQGGGHGGGRGR